jgi:hypothetical protein
MEAIRIDSIRFDSIFDGRLLPRLPPEQTRSMTQLLQAQQVQYVLLTCTFVMSMIVGVRIGIRHSLDFLLETLDFRPERGQVPAEGDLLGGRQLGQARLYVVWDWLDHSTIFYYCYCGCGCGAQKGRGRETGDPKQRSSAIFNRKKNEERERRRKKEEQEERALSLA